MDQHACIGNDVDIYCAAPITIGAYSTVSQYSYLCAATHDFEDVDHPVVAIGTPAKPVRARGLRPEDFEQTATKHEAGR